MQLPFENRTILKVPGIWIPDHSKSGHWKVRISDESGFRVSGIQIITVYHSPETCSNIPIVKSRALFKIRALDLKATLGLFWLLVNLLATSYPDIFTSSKKGVPGPETITSCCFPLENRTKLWPSCFWTIGKQNFKTIGISMCLVFHCSVFKPQL